MKNALLIASVLIFMVSCNNRKIDRSENVKKYYNAFNNSDYNEIKTLVTDSITIVEGDYIMPYSKESFYEQFKWDSIFRPTYKLVEIEELDSQIIATVAVNSLLFEFLKNNPLICQHKISFKSGKLTKIENLDCINADWVVWEKERDSLVNWISIHYPALDGFIHDLSMNGATNYLNAIELYEDRKKGL